MSADQSFAVRTMTIAGLGLMLVVVGGCTGKRSEPEGMAFNTGFTISSEGDLAIETASNYRRNYEGRIAKAINTSLVDGWEATVTIEGDPRYVDPATSGFQGTAHTQFRHTSTDRGDGWSWKEAAVQVDLVGDGSTAQPNLSASTIQEFVTKVMREKMRSDAPLEVAVTASRLSQQAVAARRTESVEGFTQGNAVASDTALAPVDDREPVVQPVARGSDVAPRPVVPATPAYDGPTVTYTVQAGDTWAGISIAFYGTADHWRHILSANPGMAVADLTAGSAIQVPLETE